MASEADEELEEFEIQRELEEARADSIAHGMRLIERYRVVREVRDEDYRDSQIMEMLIEATTVEVAARFEDEGYIATEEPVVEVLPHLFGGRVVDLENGRSITYVAAIVATIRGFRVQVG